MLVYRIENAETKFGPYSGGVEFEHCKWSSRSDLIRPGPRDDGIENIDPAEAFGFRNIDDLTCWFTIGDRKRFKRKGFVARVYSVPKTKVRFGYRQVVFYKDVAKIVDTLDVVTLGDKY